MASSAERACSRRCARRGRDPPCAGARSPRRRRRACATSAASRDLADREPELGRHVVDVVGAGRAAPGRAPLGEARLRAPRRRSRAARRARARRARVPRSTGRRARAGSRASAATRRRSSGSSSSRPSKPTRRALERGDHAGLAQQLARRARRPTSTSSSGRPSGAPRAARRVGAGDEQRQRAVGARAAAASSAIVCSPPEPIALGAHDREAAVARRLVEAGAEQEGGEPVGQLEHPLGQRHGAPGSSSAQRAGRAQRRRGVEAVERLAPPRADAASRRATSRGLGSLPGHVVVQVGVEPPVARAELGRGAERRGPRPRDRSGRAAAAASARRSSSSCAPARRAASATRERRRRCRGRGTDRRVRVGRGDGLDGARGSARRAPRSRGRLGVSRRCHRRPPRPRSRAHRPAGRRSAGRSSSAPRCCTTWVSSCASSSLAARSCRAGTRPARSRCRAGRERARRDRAARVASAVVVGVHAHVLERVAERRRRTLARARGRAAEPAPRVRAIIASTSGWAVPFGQDAVADAADHGAERLVADGRGETRRVAAVGGRSERSLGGLALLLALVVPVAARHPRRR